MFRKPSLRFLILLSSLAIPGQLLAHHGSETGGSIATLMDGSSGRSLQPASQIQILLDGRDQPDRHRKTITTTLFTELAIGDTGASAFFQIPWNAYLQEGSGNAYRYGKPVSGFRYFYGKLPASLFLSGDLSVGFPTGPDTDRFTAEDYWDGRAGVTGGVFLNPVFLALRVGGIFPLTRLNPRKKENPPLVSPMADVESLSRTPDSEQLRPVTEVSLTASWKLLDRFSLTGGLYYRTPHDGIVWTDTGTDPDPLLYWMQGKTGTEYLTDRIMDQEPERPGHYEEYSLGVNASLTERLSASVTCRVPRYQIHRVRPFSRSVQFSVTWRFGEIHYHGFEGNEPDQKSGENMDQEKSHESENSTVPGKEEH